MINKIPSLRILDFKKISKKERLDATKMFAVKDTKEKEVKENKEAVKEIME